MNQLKQWPSYFIALILFDLAVFACEIEDKPVRSHEQVRPVPYIQEGVVGRVTTSDDRSIKGAFIQPKSLDYPSQPIPEIAILSDGDGRYAWTLFPGNYEISVSVEGCQSVVKHVAVETGKVVKVDFTLQCETDHN